MESKQKHQCREQSRLVFLTAGFLFLLFSAVPAHAVKLGKLNQVERDVPVVEMLDLEDSVWTRNKFEGELTIVNFWASWCGPCREEMPSLNRAWEKVKDQGVSMVAINIGEPLDLIRGFMQQVPIDFTVLRAGDPKTFSDWGLRGLPTTLIVDSRGKIVLELVGPAEWDDDELLAPVLDLLATN